MTKSNETKVEGANTSDWGFIFFVGTMAVAVVVGIAVAAFRFFR